MTRENNPTPPTLSELLARYLHRQASAHSAGLAYSEPSGEVVPFEAVPAQPVDPRLAWDEAVVALKHYQPDLNGRSVQAPPDWPALVSSHEPEVALAFCVGNFPQLVRNLQPLWRTRDLTALRPGSARPAAVPALADWAVEAVNGDRFPQALFGVGALRLSGNHDVAGELLRRLMKDAPAEWRPALANEEAALAWHAGRADEAAALWQAQPASAPVHFNRGMAALFLGKATDARPFLQKAASELPEEGAWHHLARLYLALAEMQG